jgi:hypothetical protein
MTRAQLQSLLEKLATLPQAAEGEFFDVIDDIESRQIRPNPLSREDRLAISIGLAEARAGHYASAEAVDALFNRHFKPTGD